MHRNHSLIYETEFVVFIAVLENSAWPMDWDSSHATSTVTSEFQNFRGDVTYLPPLKTPNDVRRRSLCDINCQKYKK